MSPKKSKQQIQYRNVKHALHLKVTSYVVVKYTRVSSSYRPLPSDKRPCFLLDQIFVYSLHNNKNDETVVFHIVSIYSMSSRKFIGGRRPEVKYWNKNRN